MYVPLHEQAQPIRVWTGTRWIQKVGSWVLCNVSKVPLEGGMSGLPSVGGSASDRSS